MKIDVVDKLLSLSLRVGSSSVSIYDAIRGVGYGELTADNALHQLVEQYNRLNQISDEIQELADLIKADIIEKEGKSK